MNTLKDMKQLGQIIRSARKNQRLTQEQLAATCGTGVRFIRELEHGKESCQIAKTMTVVQMLGMELLIHSPDFKAQSGDGRGLGSGGGNDDGSGWG